MVHLRWIAEMFVMERVLKQPSFAYDCRTWDWMLQLQRYHATYDEKAVTGDVGGIEWMEVSPRGRA